MSKNKPVSNSLVDDAHNFRQQTDLKSNIYLHEGVPINNAVFAKVEIVIENGWANG